MSDDPSHQAWSYRTNVIGYINTLVLGKSPTAPDIRVAEPPVGTKIAVSGSTTTGDPG